MKRLFTTKDYNELLKLDLDGVFVTSPDFLHEEHALAVIAAGKALFLEKPMHITIEGCDRILRAAKEDNVRLFIGHNMRYMNVILKMKELIDSGAIGEVKAVWCRHFISYGGDAYFRDWHADRTKSTGMLLQKGAHDIDVIHWLSGAYSKRVAAFGAMSVYDKLPRSDTVIPRPDWNPKKHWPPKNCKDMYPIIDIEDNTSMIMELENGVIASYLQCHFTPDNCRNYTFIGTEGRLENFGHRADSPIYLWNKRKDTYRMLGDELYYPDPIEDEEEGGSHAGADPKIVQEFVDYIRDGGETVSTPQASRMAVATGYQATLSLRNGGQPMEIPALDFDLADYVY
jgi:predicted dehydrogenase